MLHLSQEPKIISILALGIVQPLVEDENQPLTVMLILYINHSKVKLTIELNSQVEVDL